MVAVQMARCFSMLALMLQVQSAKLDSADSAFLQVKSDTLLARQSRSWVKTTPDCCALTHESSKAVLPEETKKASCLSFIHIPKNMGASVEDAILKAQGFEGAWDLPVCPHVERKNIPEEQPFWGKCDDHMKCSEQRHWEATRTCVTPRSLPESVPEIIRDRALKDGCSAWHFPPAFDPTLASYYKEKCDSFCIVRDPLERFISHMMWMDYASAHPNPEEACTPEKLEHMARNLLDKLDLKEDCHIVPQVYYVFPDGNPKAPPICRHVLRFNEVNQSFPKLMSDYGLSQVKMRQPLHQTEPCMVTPTVATIDMVRSFYRLDYEAFGFEPPKGNLLITVT